MAWLDEASIPLTYDERRIVDDSRFAVVRPDVREWNLQVRDVALDDQGQYRCTVNTLPVRSKVVMLHVKGQSTRGLLRHLLLLRLDLAIMHAVPAVVTDQQDYWHCPHSMRSRIYETVRRPSVCLSHSPAAAACAGFAAVGPAGRRYRSIAARPAPQPQHGAAARRAAANAGSATFSVYVGS